MIRRFGLPLSLALNLLLLAGLFWPRGVTTAQADSRYFPETQHWVRGAFLQYWNEHGGLAQQGYPLTEEFPEVNKLNGQTYVVQYFERAIFEHHPENKPPFDILLSQLGKFELDARYPNGSNPAAAPVPGAGTPVSATPPVGTPAPTPVAGYSARVMFDSNQPAPGTPIEVTGTLLRGGQPVAGAQMRAAWRYRNAGGLCRATTGSDGVGICGLDTTGAPARSTITVDVTFSSADGATVYATLQLGFTTR